MLNVVLIYCITLQVDPKNVQSEATLLDLYRSRTLRPRTLIIYSYWYSTVLIFFRPEFSEEYYRKEVEYSWNAFSFYFFLFAFCRFTNKFGLLFFDTEFGNFGWRLILEHILTR